MTSEHIQEFNELVELRNSLVKQLRLTRERLRDKEQAIGIDKLVAEAVASYWTVEHNVLQRTGMFTTIDERKYPFSQFDNYQIRDSFEHGYTTVDVEFEDRDGVVFAWSVKLGTDLESTYSFVECEERTLEEYYSHQVKSRQLELEAKELAQLAALKAKYEE